MRQREILRILTQGVIKSGGADVAVFLAPTARVLHRFCTAFNHTPHTEGNQYAPLAKR